MVPNFISSFPSLMVSPQIGNMCNSSLKIGNFLRFSNNPSIERKIYIQTVRISLQSPKPNAPWRIFFLHKTCIFSLQTWRCVEPLLFFTNLEMCGAFLLKKIFWMLLQRSCRCGSTKISKQERNSFCDRFLDLHGLEKHSCKEEQGYMWAPTS